MELITLLTMMANDGRAHYFSLTSDTVIVETREGSSLVFDVEAASIISGVLHVDTSLSDPEMTDMFDELRAKFKLCVPELQ
jgi:hypothetical protein